MGKVNPIPPGFRTVTPYLIVKGAGALLEFLQKAFSAEIVERHAGPEGTVMHSAVRLGDSMIEVSDAKGDWTPMPAVLHLYVENAETLYGRALAAGATSLYEPADKFYGDREAGVKDSWGNYWFLATHKEDVSAEEMERRMAAERK
jgi:uncharacterized glyoxalase superfamily protein PhnB